MKLPFGLGRKPTAEREADVPNKKGGQIVRAGQSTKSEVGLFGRFGGVLGGMVPRRNVIFDLDVEALRRYPTEVLLRNLGLISPDASMAIWLMCRLCAREYTMEAIDEKGRESERGNQYLQELLRSVNKESGGLPALVVQAVKSVYVHGAVSGEVVLAENLRDVLRLVMVDPASISFFRETEGELEIPVLVPKQRQGGQYVRLDKAGFYYIPLDADIGDPHGVSPVITLLHIVFYYMGVIEDLRQVVHNQAWERLHVKVVEEVIRKNASPKLQNNDKKMAEFIDSQLDKIWRLYTSMEPDDTFVTTDATEIKEVGGKSSGGSVSVKILLDVYNRLLSNALKMMSVFLNQHSGRTETYSSVEWMIQIAGIDSMREVVRKFFAEAFSFMLQVRGIPARCRMKFEPIPLNGIITEETVKWIRTRRVLYERDAGIIDHDHAAMILYGMERAEGEEKSVGGASQPSDAGAGSANRILDRIRGEVTRGLVDNHPGGYKGLNISELQGIEQAFSRELHQEYDRMAERILDEVLKYEV